MKTIKIIGVIVALFIAVLVAFWRFAPTRMIEGVADNIGPAKTVLCQYPVKVSGEAMAPIFQHGQLVAFSKCIEDRDNIALGTIILYERPGGMRISVVRERISDANGVIYRVSQEARQNEIDEARSDRIIGIYNKEKEHPAQPQQSLPITTPTPAPTIISAPAYILAAYTGEVFGAKVPRGWLAESNQSGIEIIDPIDNDTGVSGIVAVGWFGVQTPDGFIDFLLQSIGASNIKTENASAETAYNDSATGLSWIVKTRTFTFVKNGKALKAKASVGVMNGHGQYVALMTAFQTKPEKWGQWAPMLERVAKSITIINTSMAGGAHTVRLPTAADLANDSSPLMDAWEYRNRSEARTSHEFSDAIMGQETDLISPSTGKTYTMPFSAYDPTKGGYHNPNNYGEILVDPYQK